jgi:putative glutamine amidotransferase
MTTGSTPLVGLTTYRQEASWGPWQRPAALLPVSYLDCVAAAGGRPLPLVLVGGGDIDPALYGASPHSATAGVNRRRDENELALVAAALEADLPVLAICRGLQVLNVHLGGSLQQHVPDVVGHLGHQPAPGQFGTTEVEMAPGSLLSKILGETTTVACSHHQAIDRLGAGLVVTARAPDDLIEAVELPAARFVVGVEWHPEQDGDLRLFEALVGAAR